MSDQTIKVRVSRKTITLSREAAAALIGALADALAAQAVIAKIELSADQKSEPK